MDKVKLTVLEMRNLYAAIQQISSRELPFKASYALVRTLKKIQPEWDASEEMRTKFAQRKDKGKAEEEWLKFLDSEIEVTVHKFEGALLGDKIEPYILNGLLPMLNLEDD